MKICIGIGVWPSLLELNSIDRKKKTNYNHGFIVEHWNPAGITQRKLPTPYNEREKE